MNVSLDGWNLIILGGWNPRIFTPEWLLRHVYEVGDSNIEGTQLKVEFPLEPGKPYRYSASGVRITPSLTRVMFEPLDPGEATLQLMERATIALLRTLPHTPVSAFGINFKFVDEHPEKDVVALFPTDDIRAFAVIGDEVTEQSLGRETQLDQCRLRVALTLGAQGIVASLNFHRVAEGCNQALELLANTVTADLSKAVRLLTEVYGFELAMEEAHHG